MKNLFLLFFSLIMIASCTTGEIENLSMDEGVVSEFDNGNELNLNALNALNELDYIGVSHNASLTYAAGKVDITDVADADMFNAIKEYFVKNAKSEHIAESLISQQNATLFLDIEDVYNGITFKEYNIKYGVNYSSLSQEIFSNFHRIVFEGESNYQEVLDNARTYENDFIALHSAEVNARYMGVFSILRHSFKYWVEAYENESHPWNKLAKSKDVSTTRGPGWWARIAVDIAVYNDCLENGGLGAQNLEDAQSNCLPSASYASSRAYEDGIGPLKGDDISDSK